MTLFSQQQATAFIRPMARSGLFSPFIGGLMIAEKMAEFY